MILGFVFKTILDGIFNINPYPVYYYQRYSYQLTDFLGRIAEVAFLLVVLALVLAATLIPYGLSFLFGKYLVSYFRELRDNLDEKMVRVVAGVTALVAVGVFIFLSIQPPADKYLKKLQDFSASQSFDVREIIARELMGEENAVKRAVSDMTNVRRRFLMTKDDDSLSKAYESAFSLDHDLAKAIEESFKIIGYPFVYQGNLSNQAEIAKAFESLFGNWPEDYRSDFIGQETKMVKMVNLNSRVISALTNQSGLLATVSVEEEYSNTSYRNEEVVYEFSFPAETVVTDLKLGPNLEYDGAIAPRGAAEAVYQQELRKGRDPALLEQIGVSKYRLRVFPIPPKTDKFTLGGKSQKVRFTYVTPLTVNGYALPTYTRISNLSDTGARVITTLNNKTVSPETNALSDQDARSLIIKACEGTVAAETVNLGSVTATVRPSSKGFRLPGCSRNFVKANVADVQGLRIGILYDASYANKGDRRLEEIRAMLLSTNFLQANSVDLFYFNDFISGPRQVTTSSIQSPFDVVYFGKSKPKESLKALGGVYDAVLIIPGPEKPENFGSTELAMAIRKPYPIYVLLTINSPTFSSAQTVSISQNGGTTVRSFNEVVNAVVARRSLKSDELQLSSTPFWTLILSPKDELMSQATKWPSVWAKDNLLNAFIASAVIKAKFLAYPGDVASDLTFLDEANQYAQDSRVVTPYSSLIALVNEQQRQELLNQIAGKNRYAESYVPPTTPIDMPRFIDLAPPGAFSNLKSLSVPSISTTAPIEGGIRNATGGGGSATSLASLATMSLPMIVVLNIIILVGGSLVFFFLRLRRTQTGRRHF